MLISKSGRKCTIFAVQTDQLQKGRCTVDFHYRYSKTCICRKLMIFFSSWQSTHSWLLGCTATMPTLPAHLCCSQAISSCTSKGARMGLLNPGFLYPPQSAGPTLPTPPVPRAAQHPCTACTLGHTALRAIPSAPGGGFLAWGAPSLCTHMWERLDSPRKVTLWMLGISSPSRLLQDEGRAGCCCWVWAHCGTAGLGCCGTHRDSSWGRLSNWLGQISFRGL